ncbi:conserved hypothetical protein [Gammaproteobacteria bacterium]
MNTLQTRKQLHKRIDNLPDDVIEQLAEFTLFIMKRKKIIPLYEEWAEHQWRDFALDQFFREADDIEYSLADAQEIYEKL